MSSGRVLPRVRQKLNVGKAPGYGLIQLPRTREEKIKHIQLLETIPLQMSKAAEERSRMKSGNMGKRRDAISNILLKFQSTPSDELVRTVCRACASGKFDLSLWSEFEAQTIALLPNLEVTDCGLLLKCFSISILVSAELTSRLLARICDPSVSYRLLGNYTILYALETRACSKQQLGVFLKAIFARGELETSYLISLIQVWPNQDEIFFTPILSQLSIRLDLCENASNLFILLTCISRVTHPLVRPIFERVTLPVSEYSLAQLVGIANAFSKVCPAIDQFRLLGTEISHCKIGWTSRVLSTCVSAFGRAGVLHEDLLDVWLEQDLKLLDERQRITCIAGFRKLDVLNKFPI